MTEKKGYEPDGIIRDEAEPQTGGQQPEILIMITRNHEGKLELVQHLEKTQGIIEAWTIKNLVEDAVDQFVSFIRYSQAKERQALRSPGMIQSLRNGFKNK